MQSPGPAASPVSPAPATDPGPAAREKSGAGQAAAPQPARRNARAAATREALMAAAERLFAERGVAAVSNRQVAEAAGQANNTAVAYHFGGKTDLIREIVRKHAVEVDAIRTPMLADARGSGEIRDWIRCLVLPSTRHFADLGRPTWYARFNAQVMADPTLRALLYDDALTSVSLQETLVGLRDCAGSVPLPIRRTRADMARQLLVHMCAEREREIALADEAADGQDADGGEDGEADAAASVDAGRHWTLTDEAAAPVGTWEELGVDLVDALTGLWSAPVTR